ncbi:ankyrin repeat domain-containing protein [Candidatus Babeliales bacterium]|nr:ankyrin repeat domain-containing protein [Candidatus Babeliales bacterium]
MLKKIMILLFVLFVCADLSGAAKRLMPEVSVETVRTPKRQRSLQGSDQPIMAQGDLTQAQKRALVSHCLRCAVMRKKQGNGVFLAVRKALEDGADPNVVCFVELGCKSYPLHLVVRSRFYAVAMAQLLLEHGAILEAEDKDGLTPLFFAVEHGNVKLVEFFLERGACVNVLSACGQTPLMRAVFYGDVYLVRLLLEHGASVNIVSKAGFTVFDYRASLAIQEMLQEARVVEEKKDQEIEVFRKNLMQAVFGD